MEVNLSLLKTYRDAGFFCSIYFAIPYRKCLTDKSDTNLALGWTFCPRQAFTRRRILSRKNFVVFLDILHEFHYSWSRRCLAAFFPKLTERLLADNSNIIVMVPLPIFSWCPCVSMYSGILQKQSFADVLENWCSEKFRKIHIKIPVVKSLFNKNSGLRPATLSKRESITSVFLWIVRNL